MLTISLCEISLCEKTNNLYNVFTNRVMPNDHALRFFNAVGTGAD